MSTYRLAKSQQGLLEVISWMLIIRAYDVRLLNGTGSVICD